MVARSDATKFNLRVTTEPLVTGRSGIPGIIRVDGRVFFAVPAGLAEMTTDSRLGSVVAPSDERLVHVATKSSASIGLLIARHPTMARAPQEVD